MAKVRRWTKSEIKQLQDIVNSNNNSNVEAFKEAACILNRSEGACCFQYYNYGKPKFRGLVPPQTILNNSFQITLEGFTITINNKILTVTKGQTKITLT